jgi:hypothetical protein
MPSSRESAARGDMLPSPPPPPPAASSAPALGRRSGEASPALSRVARGVRADVSAESTDFMKAVGCV